MRGLLPQVNMPYIWRQTDILNRSHPFGKYFAVIMGHGLTDLNPALHRTRNRHSFIGHSTFKKSSEDVKLVYRTLQQYCCRDVVTSLSYPLLLSFCLQRIAETRTFLRDPVELWNRQITFRKEWKKIPYTSIHTASASMSFWCLLFWWSLMVIAMCSRLKRTIAQVCTFFL